MSRSRISIAAFVAAVAFGAAACSDSSQPTVPSGSDPSDDLSLRAAQGEVTNPNDLARGVKGFGGFFLDEQGAPTIYLKDAAQKDNAGRALGRYFQAAGISPSRLQVLRGQFDWNELERWFALASSDVLALPGTVFADADEANNRVTIGIERGSGAQGAVRSAAARLGIPAEALLIEEMEPVRFAATLRDAFRPTIGGIQINFPGFLCTLGFNAIEGTTGPASFITNSHCTNTQGGVESTPYWQPLQSTHPTQIATEVEDPTYRKNLEPRCPRGKRCRYSDASRAQYASGITSTRGSIAKTTGPNNGSLTTSGNFTITGERLDTTFVVGTTVNKVGRTTGWTQGRVSNTCVTTGVSGTSIAQICQTFVTAGVGGGDSGSPVFIITSGDNVSLAGILWGGSGSSLFVFSPLRNIEREIGSLTVN
jgi:hypothetical protein